MKGDSTIDRITATSSSCTSCGVAAPPCTRMVKSAMPNSPPAAITTPVRSALKLESTNTRVTNAAIVPFTSSMPASRSEMTQNSRNSSRTSSSMPTEMKNRPSSMSRNGRITASTWWRYSVSASIMPARNAPSASDSPARCDTQAELKTTNSTASVNSSRSRLWAIS